MKTYLNSSEQKDYENSYATSVVKPSWYPKDLKKINTVISSFETTFVHTTDRGHNIQVGVSRVNGICLLPGESCSFDERIHDNSDGQAFRKANSYLPKYISNFPYFTGFPACALAKRYVFSLIFALMR